ncbi:MAG: hypothetical protein JWQ76_4332 [Ramlibacter sp.]|nr:hypothetical protein [Ramlibacter sp.]
MRLSHRPLRAAALILFCSLLASCGGGGGGGGDSGAGAAGSAPPGNTGFDALSISLMSPTKVQAEYPETAYAPGFSIFIRANGDYLQLVGKTIYAIVEDPDSLVNGVTNVSVDQHPPADGTGPQAIISLASRQMNTPGRFQGEFKVHACLDKDCRTELAGSPLHIPYDVTVRAGMQLQHEALAVTVPFGSVPPEQTVDVGLPSYLSSWNALAATRTIPSTHPPSR